MKQNDRTTVLNTVCADLTLSLSPKRALPKALLSLLAGAAALTFVSAVPVAAEDPARLLIANSGQPFPAKNGKQSLLLQVPEEAPRKAAEDPSQKLDAVDTAALYYYAKERQNDRVEAEIQRLQALHPGFVPPQDLYISADRIVPDESNLWALFENDDFTGIDAEIIRRKAENSAWEPTEDFQAKLVRKKLRVRMKELTGSQDWFGLIDLSAGIDPATEPDVDLVWMRADALSAAGDRDTLALTLRGLLVREGPSRLSDENLLVTLQKALKDFPASEIRLLAASLWPDTSGQSLPSSLRLDLARKDIAEFNSGEQAEQVSPDTVRLLSIEARNTGKPEDLALLGWYHLKVDKPEMAGEWFSVLMEGAPNPESAKGMYLSLSRQKQDKAAYDFASTHLQDLSDDAVFLMNALAPRFGKQGETTVSADVVRAYSTAIMETNAADHAEILGWYAYNSRQFEAAEAWFRQSYDWEASADRIKGLALTLIRLDKKKGYAALKQEFAEVYPDIWSEITVASVPKARKAASVRNPAQGVKSSYVRHFEAKNYSACLRDIDSLGAKASGPSIAVIRGWCELGLNRFGDARVSFEAAMAGSGQVRTDGIYGAALALLGARLTDEAEALIAAWPLPAARERELKIEIYYQRARSSFEHKQFDRTLAALDARAALVAESRDLMQMRAWAYHHLGQSQQAKAIFRQLNMVMRDNESLAAIELIKNSERK